MPSSVSRGRIPVNHKIVAPTTNTQTSSFMRLLKLSDENDDILFSEKQDRLASVAAGLPVDTLLKCNTLKHSGLTLGALYEPTGVV